jgi:hypothetical protein
MVSQRRLLNRARNLVLSKRLGLQGAVDLLASASSKTGFSVHYLSHTLVRIQTAEQLQVRMKVKCNVEVRELPERATCSSTTQCGSSWRSLSNGHFGGLGQRGFRSYLQRTRCRSQQENAEGFSPTHAVGDRLGVSF